MADIIGKAQGDIGTAGKSRSVYQAEGVREVRARAQFLDQDQTPQEQAGLKRLNRLMQHGQPLNDAAPRGFYLNIRV